MKFKAFICASLVGLFILGVLSIYRFQNPQLEQLALLGIIFVGALDWLKDQLAAHREDGAHPE